MERRRQGISHLVLRVMLLACLLVGVRETIALEVGEKAPDFTLPSTMGDEDQSEPVPGQAVRAHRVLWR